MGATLLLGYTTVGLVFWMHAMARLARMGRGRRRRMGGLDGALLTGVALLASAAWIVLLAALAVGWLRSPRGHRALVRLRAGIHSPRFAAGLGR